MKWLSKSILWSPFSILCWLNSHCEILGEKIIHCPSENCGHSKPITATDICLYARKWFVWVSGLPVLIGCYLWVDMWMCKIKKIWFSDISYVRKHIYKYSIRCCWVLWDRDVVGKKQKQKKCHCMVDDSSDCSAITKDHPQIGRQKTSNVRQIICNFWQG